MARGAQGAAGKGKGVDPPARPARAPSAATLPWVKVEKSYVFDTPNGKRDARRSVRRPQPADRQPLHAGARPEGRLRRLLVRGRSRRRRAACIWSITTSPWSRSRARRCTRSKPTRRAWAGASSGCRRTAATSTTTSMCRSRRSRSPSGEAFYNYDKGKLPLEDLSGLQRVLKDANGDIFHTYSTFGARRARRCSAPTCSST